MEVKDLISDLIYGAIDLLITEENHDGEDGMGYHRFRDGDSTIHVKNGDITITLNTGNSVATFRFREYEEGDAAEFVTYANEVKNEVLNVQTDKAFEILRDLILEEKPELDAEALQQELNDALANPDGVPNLRKFAGLTEDEFQVILKKAWDMAA